MPKGYTHILEGLPSQTNSLQTSVNSPATVSCEGHLEWECQSPIFLAPTNPKPVRSRKKSVPMLFLIQPLYWPRLVFQRSTRTLEVAQGPEHPAFQVASYHQNIRRRDARQILPFGSPPGLHRQEKGRASEPVLSPPPERTGDYSFLDLCSLLHS